MADIKRQNSSKVTTSGPVKPVKMDRRSASRARSSGRSGSEASDSEKVTLYLSGQKASEYQQQQKKNGEELLEDVVAIKCDSDKEVNTLKRKNVATNQATCETQEPTYAAVLKQSDKENSQPTAVATPASNKRMKMDPLHGEAVKVVVNKPPIPPKPDVSKAPSPPAAMKSKKHVVSEAHNALTVQKLLAQNEQMRLEINELRTSLATERGAVRVLRAQNESDLRRTKTECKKLQEALSHQKRNSAAPAPSVPTKPRPNNRSEGVGAGDQSNSAASCGSSSNGGQTHALSQLNMDVLKLNQELSALRETNKFLEEKIQISSEAERRKASDFRVQRDLYELRLTQLTKSAKSEIQRLLEELKSKDRNIGLLKKEILALHGGGGGGASTATKKERKAAKNSAQQSQEMRKVREPEPCSGTVSKSTSHSSIQSSACEEELEQHNAEADRVAAVRAIEQPAPTTIFCCKCSPASVVAPTTTTDCSTSDTTATKTSTSSSRVADGQQNTTNVYCSNGSNVELGLDTTTCGDDSSNRSMPHESRTIMEAHNDDESHHHQASASSSNGRLSEPSVLRTTTTIMTTVRQLSTVSDADSAISSAPASLSPQPTSCPNSPEVWRAHPSSQEHQQIHLQSLRDQSQLAEIKLELDRMQAKYNLLSADYGKAKDQINALERELLETTQTTRERAKLTDRIEYLEQREESLLRESHELREQNELLEFRIIELEESHDKWSLRSNSSPATVGSGSSSSSSSTEGHGHGHSSTKDVWTDTVDKHHHHHHHHVDPDDLIMGHHHHHHHHHHSERSDSGVTSPNSHHHLDDTRTSGVPSPCCDLSLLDQIPTDDVRKRIITMSKRACYDEEDKQCLLQILTLLNNLEALSQDHEIGVTGVTGVAVGGEEMSLEVAPVKYNYPFPENNAPPKLITSTPFKTTPANQGKIVATVQPFNNTSTSIPNTNPSNTNEPPPKQSISIASIAEQFGGMKKSTTCSSGKWGSTSLQESGVFVDEMMMSCTGTQTELEDFPCLERTNAELCAEIEKLNKFRQKIEECSGGGSRVKNPVGVSLSLPAENCEARRLQYYVTRLEQLENKVKVYESSGDQQLRHLANRMQREIQLEGWVDQLSERVGKLEDENERLEEERCELEEIENDTRLRLQRMEVDYEVMSQRNSELEMSKNQYQSKYQDARDSIMNLEELVLKCEERIFVLEETENELNDRIDLILAFIPVLLMYNSWQLQEQMAATKRQFNAINYIPPEHIEYYESTNGDLQSRLGELMTREKELTQNIAELNRAYNETLENADNLWAQMEKEYKDKISKCETVEANLKSKISQLEQRLTKDSEYAHERISHLEEAENSLKSRVSKLNKENKELIAKHAALLEEYTSLKEEYRKLQAYLRGPAAENLEREKRKALTLEEELSHSSRQLREAEAVHRTELGQLRGQLSCASKELNHIEVTNSELREEVETLESRIRELLTLRNADDERIKHLAEELQAKQAQIQQMQHQFNGNGIKVGGGGGGRSLAQELERPIKGSYSKLGYEIHPLNRRFPGDSDSSGSEDKIKFPIKSVAADAKEVKSLAETIILNAESRGIRTAPKKSFVEEARSRFARWV